MTRSEVKRHLEVQVHRQQAFFADKSAGGLLAYVTKIAKEEHNDTAGEKDADDLKNKAGLAGSVYRAVIDEDGNVVPDEKAIDKAVADFVREYREDAGQCKTPRPGDAIPCVYAHWDIGWHTAAMTGLAPRFSRGSWWLEPNLEWEDVEALRFNADNPWLLTAKYAHRALWKYWDEDFWTMPHIHRSPLDYANGVRGTRLFMEMMTDPDRVKRLIDWCVDWQLQAEAFMYEDVDVQEGWGTGIMDTWGPDKAVWVNGDPVGLISRQMMREFEQPYTGRLFSSTGGGFFHNHTLGIYQADQVCATPGIHMQNFTKDPNRRSLEEALIEDAVARDRILEGSLETPILTSGIWFEDLEPLLPIVREGRFMVSVACETDGQVNEAVRMIRRAGSL